MMESLIITLREGMEAALIIGIVLAYLSRIDRPDLRWAVWSGLGAAVAASLAGAWYLERLPWKQETMEGVVMIVAAVLVTTMVIWMWRVARRLRSRIETRVDTLARRSRFAWPGLFVFVLVMVLREGVETVLILRALTVKTGALGVLLGAVVGLALATAAGVLFFRGTWRIDLARFFRITGFVLLLVAAQLVLKGLLELHEGGALALGHALEEGLERLEASGAMSFVFVLLVTAVLVSWEWWNKRRQIALVSVTDSASASKR